LEADWSIGEVWQQFYQGPRPSRFGNVVPIDIAVACNESRCDDVSGDGTGWFDYGKGADLSRLTPGELAYQNLRFRIVDEKANNGKGAIIVATKDTGAKAPDKTTGIPVKLKAKSLVFLHIANDGPHSKPFGKYVVHYDDGTTVDVPIVYGQNIGPWLLEKQYSTFDFYGAFYNHGYLSESRLAYTGATRGGDRVALQLYEWVNPHPDKTIATIDLMVDADAGKKLRIATLALSSVQ
jgi:hypothetical protein